MKHIVSTCSLILLASTVSAEVSQQYTEISFIKGLEIHQTLAGGHNIQTDKDTIKAAAVIRKRDFRVSADFQAELYDYVNLSNEACVQYVKFAHEIYGFNGIKPVEKVGSRAKFNATELLGTEFLIDEFCAPISDKQGEIYPMGLAGIINITENENAKWQFPMFE
ncbi:hypothetical protein [Vibrio cholerae]|uniref:hypothetical protein n=1 Tax=Vibrio cholerae TaxID=666 RepID=UPI003080A5BF